MTLVYGIIITMLVLLLLLLLLLLVPVRYDFELSTEGDLRSRFRVYWGSSSIARVVLSYDKEKSFWYQIKVPGKTIEKKEEVKEEIKEESIRTSSESVVHETYEKTVISEEIEQQAEPSKQEVKEEAEASEEVIVEKKQRKMPITSEQRKALQPYLLSWATYQELFLLFHRMYTHSKPREFYLKGTFGTGNPAFTGMLSGFLYSLWPARMMDIELEYLDVVYEFQTSLKGRIIPLVTIWYGIQFGMSKAIRPIIGIMVRGGNHGR